MLQSVRSLSPAFTGAGGSIVACRDLPTEVWLMIFRWVSKRQLFILCKVNKRIRDITADLLYKRLSNPEFDIWLTLPKQPDLARRVRFFELTSFMLFTSGTDFRLLKSALACLPNLRTLKLLNGGGIYSFILKDCTSKLRIFHTTWDCSPTLLAFLRRQPDLVDLSLSGSIDEGQLKAHIQSPLSFLPKLSRLRAPLSFVKFIIPGRKAHGIIGFEPQDGLRWERTGTQSIASVAPLHLTDQFRSLGAQEIVSLLPQFACLTVRVVFPDITCTDREVRCYTTI
ncbi:hypothetical protein BV22DRAFT_418715 [Leucogyrophana mollusca]|uniref:Uncharacterized protein n=1 Tax=Leucogyrophana mollusca TaxID=85980 RepID=A0ACB8BKE7_9AGAM|nr:hypothetical protein BV22DRAFT_418715 [Leucogyrophana mollusca]